MSVFHFDINKYKALDSDNSKLIYINECIFFSEKTSTVNAIKELEYIRFKIRKHCSATQVIDGFITGIKGISRTDGSMLNYVNGQIDEYSELAEIISSSIPSPDFRLTCKFNSSQIEQLYDKLKVDFIDNSCTIDNFKAIFNNENIQIDREKIIWLGKADNKQFSPHSLFELLNQCFPHILDQPRGLLYSFILNHFLDGKRREYERDNIKSSFSTFKNKLGRTDNRTKSEAQIISFCSSL